jgi:hypothetical protein
MKKYREVKVLSAEEMKDLSDRDPVAFAGKIAEGKMLVLEEGQEVTLLKEESDRVLILPDGSDTAYWMSREDIAEF